VTKQVWSVLLVGCLLFCVISNRPRLSASETETRSAERTAILAVLSAQQTAWNKGDVDVFLQGYWHSPDLTFSGSTGTTRGWEGVLARYKLAYPNRAAMGQLDFSDLQFRFLGPQAALVLGRWHLVREKDELGGVFSLVWQRFPEGWQIVHDHTSVVPAKTLPQE
jgi:ketosteroid isomerase-like protein